MKEEIYTKLKKYTSFESQEFLDTIDFDNKHFAVARRLDMNPRSLSLLFKSQLYGNSSLIFFTSLINYFQSLSTSPHRLVPYIAYTNALVVYFLRAMAKEGIVEIYESKKESCIYLNDYYYEALGNKIKNHRINMYEITFFKVRSLTEKDIPLLERVMRTIKIPSEYISFKSHGGTISAKIEKCARNEKIGPKLILKEVKAYRNRTKRVKYDKNDIRNAF